MKKTQLAAILFLVVAIAASAAILSRSRAIARCDLLMGSHIQQCPYYGTSFTAFLKAHFPPFKPVRFSPGWRVSYDTGFGVGPLSFYVDIFGHILASNPPDTLPFLRSGLTWESWKQKQAERVGAANPPSPPASEVR